MLHFTFEIQCLLVKEGETPLVVQTRVMDLYFHTYVQVAYHTCKSFIQDGWNLQEVAIGNYQFTTLSYDET
jgi:hypothetical protein